MSYIINTLISLGIKRILEWRWVVDKKSNIVEWMPVISKLVWPFFIGLILLVFNAEVSAIYKSVMEGGRGVKIAGVFELGEAANKTQVMDLSDSSMSLRVDRLGGSNGGAIEKGTYIYLRKLKEQIKRDPSIKLETLIIKKGPTFYYPAIREYIGSLGLKYVVFINRGKFEGWMNSSVFVAQLQGTKTAKYENLVRNIVGIKDYNAKPDDSVKVLLNKMDKYKSSALPVVDNDNKWQFFVNRGDIIAKLLTNMMSKK